MVEPTPLKNMSQIGCIFPKFRVENSKYLSCHHLVINHLEWPSVSRNFTGNRQVTTAEPEPFIQKPHPSFFCCSVGSVQCVTLMLPLGPGPKQTWNGNPTNTHGNLKGIFPPNFATVFAREIRPFFEGFIKMII